MLTDAERKTFQETSRAKRRQRERFLAVMDMVATMGAFLTVILAFAFIVAMPFLF